VVSGGVQLAVSQARPLQGRVAPRVSNTHTQVQCSWWDCVCRIGCSRRVSSVAPGSHGLMWGETVLG